MALISVSGHLKDVSGANIAGSVVFQLVNYGAAIPRVIGTNALVPTNVTFTAAANGAWSGNVQGNDSIDPGASNTPPTTYYTVQFRDANGAEIQTVAFNFTGSGPSNLDSQAPLVTIPSPSAPPNTAALLASNNTFTGALNTFTGITQINGIQTVAALTDAAIVSTIAAVADGGTVYMPAGTYVCNASLPITITKRISIVGAGWGTVLQVASTVGATTDVFLCKPSNATDIQGVKFENFRIQPQSGTPGRYGINFDGTNASFAYMEIDKLRIDALGNYAIAVTNAGSNNNGTPYTTSIRDCVINGGILLNGAGDDVLILRNTFTGARDVNITTAPVGRVGTDGGAHGFLFMENDVTSAGGIVIINAWQGALLNNDIEATVTSTETNNAVIDLQGNSSPGAVQNFIIQNNYIGANSSFVADAIRVDKAYHTIIRNNYVTRGSGVAYRLTANANRTAIEGNTQAPNGESITVWLADSGTATTVDYFQPSSAARVMTNAGFGSNTTSTPFFYFPSVQGRAGSTAIWGWASGTDPSSAGLDTGLSRISAGLVGIGNGTQADFSGTLKVSSILGAVLTGASSGNNVTLLNYQTAKAAITGNAADQAMYSYSLPANTVATGKGLRITASWSHSTGAASVVYKLKINGTALAAPGGITTAGAHTLTLTVMAAASTTFDLPTFWLATGSTLQSTTGSSTSSGGMSWTSNQTIELDFNVANTDQVTPGSFVVELIQ